MTDPTIVVGVAGIGLVAGATIVQMAAPVQVSSEISTTLIISAAVGGIVTVITATTAAVVTIMEKWAATEDRRQAKDAREKAEKADAIAVQKSDLIVEKTTEIHTAANSTLAKATAALELARMEFKGLQDSTSATIKGLEQKVVEMEKAREAAVAATPATVPVAHPQPPTIVVAPLPAHAVVQVPPGLAVTTAVSEKVESKLDSIEKTVEDTHEIVKELPPGTKT